MRISPLWRYQLASAFIFIASRAQDADGVCEKVQSWDDLASKIQSVTTETTGGRNKRKDGRERWEKGSTIVLCPFSITHDGGNNDGIDIDAALLTLVCDKNSGGLCEIEGTARHFNVNADWVSFVGINFLGSKNGAVLVGIGIVGTMFSQCTFQDNIRSSGNGGAIELITGSSSSLVSQCQFADNSAINGGAISGFGAIASVYGSEFYFNEARSDGGGINMNGNFPYMLQVTGSKFVYNVAEGNGPIVWDGSSLGFACDAGSNFACQNFDFSENLSCDGFSVAVGGCNEFADTCSPASNRADDLSISSDFFAPSAHPSSAHSNAPSRLPSALPSSSPSVAPSKHRSDLPSMKPSANPTLSPTSSPSTTPSTLPSVVPTRTSSSVPSNSPSKEASAVPSQYPSANPSTSPSAVPSLMPTTIPSKGPSQSPSVTNSDEPSAIPSNWPSKAPSASPSALPSRVPSVPPTASLEPSLQPSMGPSPEPSSTPSVVPSNYPSGRPSRSPSPTLSCRVDKETRMSLIQLEVAAAGSDISDLTNLSTPQGKALDWISNRDALYLCTDDTMLVQRYVMAVFYYSTSGDDWSLCSADPGKVCFGSERFLSEYNECTWRGVTCNPGGKVTKISFEDNNLDGKIPSELSALTDLTTLSLEQGQLRGGIPSELSTLSKLTSLDLDFNSLSGTLPAELSQLKSLRLLDLNDNDLTGNLDPIEDLTGLLFLQLHSNRFSGTISDGLGALTELRAMTLYSTKLQGTMPESVCMNRVGNGGKLEHLEVDCAGSNADVTCSCCSHCWTENPTAAPSPTPSAQPSSEPTSLHSSSPSISPAPSVKCNMDILTRSFNIQSVLSNTFDLSDLQNGETAQSMAFQWLIAEDDMYLCPDDGSLVQRFAMAAFYFATGGDSWTSCSAVTETDCSGTNQRFLSAASECSWAGVSCNDGVVTSIVFEHKGLAGTIPIEILALESLEILKLEQGQLTGPIPSFLGGLIQLQELDLDFNQFTGSIPTELSLLTNLRILDLNNNPLVGSIGMLADLESLTFLQLHRTDISGTIPDALGNLDQMETMSLYATNLQGTMPKSVCKNRDTLGGNLKNLQADCAASDPSVRCICCTACFSQSFPLRRLGAGAEDVIAFSSAMRPSSMPVLVR